MLYSNQFTVFKDKKLAVAERSDFGPDFNDSECAVWPSHKASGPDEGFEVKSIRTGKVSTWVLKKDHFDENEYELLFSDFVPSVKSLQWFPELAGWTIRLYND